jgi:hypothetical protein
MIYDVKEHFFRLSNIPGKDFPVQSYMGSKFQMIFDFLVLFDHSKSLSRDWGEALGGQEVG